MSQQRSTYNEEKDAEYQHANKTGNGRTVIYMLTTRHIDTHQHIWLQKQKQDQHNNRAYIKIRKLRGQFADANTTPYCTSIPCFGALVMTVGTVCNVYLMETGYSYCSYIMSVNVL